MWLCQVFTGDVPWPKLQDMEILRAVGFEDRRPPRPSKPATLRGLDDAMWDLIQACWRTKPTERPDMIQIVTHFTSDLLVQQSTIKTFDPLSKRQIPSSEDAELPSNLNGISEYVNIYRYSNRMPLLEIQWLSQVCKDGRVNAVNLHEALKFAKPADVNEGYIKASVHL